MYGLCVITHLNLSASRNQATGWDAVIQGFLVVALALPFVVPDTDPFCIGCTGLK